MSRERERVVKRGREKIDVERESGEEREGGR